MNCRVIIFAVNFLVAVAVLGSFCQTSWAIDSTATRADAVDWGRFAGKNLIIQSESSGNGEVYATYPLWLQTIYTKVMNWEPRVKRDTLQESRCRLSFSSQNLETRVVELTQFLKEKPKCSYLAAAENMSTLRKVMRSLSIEFDMSDVNHFRKVLFKVPGADSGKVVHLRGLIGIHDDKKPRPLVVLRMGVHGNVDEFLAERFLAKVIYEDFGFNFLALESLTSHGYLSLDNPVTFGGVDEGLHTFYVLEELRTSEIKKLFSDIHLLGVSLGAHGVFLTEALDEVNKHYIKSVTTFCPVINLVSTMSNQQDAKINFGLIDIWNYRRLQAVRQRLPELEPKDWWKIFFDFKPRYVPGIVNYLETNRTKPTVKLPQGIQWPAGLKNHLQNSNAFSKLNNYWEFYENLKTPLLIVTTPNDLVVSAELNTDLILQKKQKGKFNKTLILQLDKGLHCGLATDYQWDFVVNLLRTQWGDPLQ